MSSNNKMNKNTVPEGFTVPMALVDFLPVLFFGGTGFLLGIILGNPFVEICAVIVFVSGFLKVIWKMIAAVQKKNIWLLFVQMRIFMPVGFVLMLAGIIFSLTKYSAHQVLTVLLGIPQVFFFAAGILGLAFMIFCAVKMDSSDPRSNWIEQAVNSAAQACIFIGLLMIVLNGVSH